MTPDVLYTSVSVQGTKEVKRCIIASDICLADNILNVLWNAEYKERNYLRSMQQTCKKVCLCYVSFSCLTGFTKALSVKYDLELSKFFSEQYIFFSIPFLFIFIEKRRYIRILRRSF